MTFEKKPASGSAVNTRRLARYSRSLPAQIVMALGCLSVAALGLSMSANASAAPASEVSASSTPGSPAPAVSTPPGTTTLGQVSQPTDSEAALINKGRLLAVASDCMACHTVTGKGKAFSGGYPIVSPLGTIYSTNITPSKTSGIGNYTEAQFAAALREGVRADGAHLYPAMPYTSYTLLTDDDVHALYTYFMKGVEPVDVTPPVTALPFPFNMRFSMAAWNLLFLHDTRFTPDPTKSTEWNRGAYLTTALGHCDACHTPRNFLMAEDTDRAFAGAQLGAWYAPNITSDPVSGIGSWENKEIVQYLKTGHVAGKNQAGGGMAEAVQNSLQFLSTEDLNAIAVYLKSSKPVRDPLDHQAAYTYGSTDTAKQSEFEAQLRGMSPSNNQNPLTSGAALYSGNCASCHGIHGQGSANQAYPSLVHNTATGASDPSNLVATILNGIDRQVGNEHVLMPGFGKNSYVAQLTDQQIADISNFVLSQYGNPDVKVTAHYVSIARSGGQLPFLAWIQPYIVRIIIAVVVLIVVLVFGVIAARRKKRTAA